MSSPRATLAACLAVLTLALTAPLAAQAGPRRDQGHLGLRQPMTAMASPAHVYIRPPRQTQWLKGGVIGGVAGTLLGLLVVSAADGISDSGTDGADRLRGAAAGAGLGFLIGALVGGQFEKF